jgi:hypothetical protein
VKVYPIEATNGANWGKFAVARPGGDEWAWSSQVGHPGIPLLSQVGWARDHLWVMDLQTGEGGIFYPGGKASADLDKKQIWVCPMFEPFLNWLYAQDLSDLEALPSLVELPEAPFSMSGYRRGGQRRSAHG